MSTQPQGRRRRDEEEEEHEDSERWLVTYADMLTLLMVLFIVMFAMSQVDEKKYNALRSGLADGFGQTTSYMKGSNAILDADGVTLSPELVSTETPPRLTPSQQKSVSQAVDRQGPTNEQRYAEAVVEANRLEEIRKKVEKALREHHLSHDVQTLIDERGLVISLVSRHVVFPANVAKLSTRGQRVVDVISPVLREIPDELRIDGHTNQVAVQPKYYATDWDLSAARAVTVLRRINEVGGVPEERLTMSAFGHQEPLIDPSTPGSQKINKRVDIVVLSGIAPDSAALLPGIARARAPFNGGS